MRKIILIFILYFIFLSSYSFADPWKGYPYKSDEIPESARPDYKILKHYVKKYANNSKRNKAYKFKIKATENYKKFNFNLKKEDYVTKQLQETALLSYLVYENENITQDEITPKDRFGKYFKNDTKWQSMSMGKSIISYIAGHAICRGYISGINETLDWDIFDNTLYEGQKLINVLNMASGSEKYKDFSGFKKSKRWVNTVTVQSAMKKELKNSIAGKNNYNYSNMDTNVVASYLLHKVGQENFKLLLNEIFVNKVGIEHDVLLFKPGDASGKTESLTYTFFISRYDYLRIAIAMLEDWQNNSCEGQYLKSLWENRIRKGKFIVNDYHGYSNPNHYGGQFHMSISGKRDVPIFILDGFGGQTININFEDKKIISTLSIHRNYNWMKLVHEKL